jgi:hypothetical protein
MRTFWENDRKKAKAAITDEYAQEYVEVLEQIAKKAYEYIVANRSKINEQEKLEDLHDALDVVIYMKEA